MTIIKTLFGCLFILAFLNSKAQEKIEGIGKFKINKTTSDIIDSFVAQEKYTVFIAMNLEQQVDYETKPKSIVYFYFDSSNVDEPFISSHVCD